ncbi:MAG: serine/threonine protein kinase [Firmicutes bacterium]|nr:serine/threonine protein kinase [Bacillota bacterium]
MIDLSFLQPAGYTVLKKLSHKVDSAVLYVQRTDDTRLVLRIYRKDIPAYRALTGHHCETMPLIYRTFETEGCFLVEEEFIDGVSLQEMISGGARMDEDRTRIITGKICAAASFLHAAGFIHRDIKPEHVLLTAEGRTVLTDLDASMKIVSGKDSDTQLLGTAIYAAPEQFGLSRSDARTDIYAMGILMNELLTGLHPAVTRYEAGPLKDVISRCTQMNPADRYQTMEALAHALKEEAEKKTTPVKNFSGWKRAAAAAAAICALGLAVWILPGEIHVPDGNALADEVGQTQAPAMVQGTEYLQLYREGSRETVYHNFRLGAQSAALYTEDGILVDETWKVYADRNIGFIERWEPKYHGWTLVSENCEMGATGYLHAEKDGKHYAIEVMVVGEPMSAYSKVPALADYTDGYIQPKVHSNIRAGEIVRLTYSPAQPKTVYLVAMDGFRNLQPNCDSSLVTIKPYENALAWDEPVFAMTFDNPDGGDAVIDVISNHNSLTFYFEEE